MMETSTLNRKTSSVIGRVRRENRRRIDAFPSKDELKLFQFELAHHLQCSLDLETTLELFYEKVLSVVKFSGMKFQAQEDLPAIELGNAARHTANYAISSTEVKLGNIEFSRDKRFNDVELAGLEMVIGMFYFPLRNVLLYQQALKSSLLDALTGISNRSALDINLAREIKLSSRHNNPLSLLVIDIDHFKKVNDTFGHHCGDTVLKRVCETIQGSLRESDQMFRFGGEEFVVILDNTDLNAAQLAAERIRLKVASTGITINKEKLHCSVSIGISCYQHNDTAETFFERADAALYLAKGAGRNKVMFSGEVKVLRQPMRYKQADSPEKCLFRSNELVENSWKKGAYSSLL